LKPHTDTILQHGKQQMGSKLAPLAQQIAITGKTPSDHKTSDIYQNAQTGTSVKWYEAHRADFKELLDNLYKNHMPSQVTEDEIRKKCRSRAHGSGNTRRADAFNARNERNGQPRTERHTQERTARTQEFEKAGTPTSNRPCSVSCADGGSVTTLL
jgi:hypothetical protein